jgi:hypothetical protein
MAQRSSFMTALQTAPLAELQQEVREVDREMARLQTKRSLLEMAIQWKLANGAQPGRGKRPPAADEASTHEARPSLRVAVLRILSEAGRPLGVQEIYAELERRDWLPGGANPKSQLAARISKMRANGFVVRTGTGVYALATSTAEPG